MAGRAAQLAKDEADRVEAEEAAAEAAAAQEARNGAESDDESATQDTPEISAEAAAERLDALLTRHEEGLRELFGEDWEGMAPCSFCQGFGFRNEPTMRPHPDMEECSTCAGWGVLVTHSNRPEKASIDCTSCGGNGYTMKIPQQAAPAAYNAQPIYIDVTTGLPAVPQPAQPPLPAQGEWAPGHVPQPQPMPATVPHS